MSTNALILCPQLVQWSPNALRSFPAGKAAVLPVDAAPIEPEVTFVIDVLLRAEVHSVLLAGEMLLMGSVLLFTGPLHRKKLLRCMLCNSKVLVRSNPKT